ncbi:MAG: hypothetical protein ACXVXW_07560 [Mycobacteriaceae bacterium]
MNDNWWSHKGQYPEDFGRCVVCGADRSQPCDTVSEPGTPRAEPHFYRGAIGVNEPAPGFTPVRDEPDHPQPPTCQPPEEAL